jgi:hypothetical protein
VAAAVPLPLELSDVVAEGDPVAVADAVSLSIEVPVAVPVVVELTLPLPVELSEAVVEGESVVVAITLSDDWGEPDEASEEESDSLRTELCDAVTECDLVTKGDDESVVLSVFVFELVKDCDVLDECVGVLEAVVLLLTDVETLDDFVATSLPV